MAKQLRIVLFYDVLYQVHEIKQFEGTFSDIVAAQQQLKNEMEHSFQGQIVTEKILVMGHGLLWWHGNSR